MNGQPQPPSESFIDWWFAPWTLSGAPAPFGHGAGTLALRHGYRCWCDAAGVPADLPASLERGWHALAVSDALLLRRAALLYAALLAVRLARHAQLTVLNLVERRWCMSVANTQPLQPVTAPGPGSSLEEWGIAELAAMLELECAGLWPRLRIVLGVGAMPLAPVALTPAAATRSLRCWRMCLAQAGRPISLAAA